MKELIDFAINARNNSYSPYSKFKVGAALLTKNGRMFGGTNIENVSYGLSNCAERSCLFSAYSNGVKKDDIVAFAIVGDTINPISPCGACRQVMAELMNPNTKVYLGNLNGKTKCVTVSELLPYAFEEIELHE